MPQTQTVLMIFAGLFGALGVAGVAAAAHGAPGAELLQVAAAIALVHAPALLSLAAVPDALMRLRWLCGLLLVSGTLLFSGDMAARVFLEGPLFARAAPTGGLLLILGWFAIVVGALVAGRAGGMTRAAARDARDRPG